MSELPVYETWPELYGHVEVVATDAPSGVRLVNADDYDILQSERDGIRKKFTDCEREAQETYCMIGEQMAEIVALRIERGRLAERNLELVEALERVMKINEDIRINLIDCIEDGPERSAFWMSVEARNTARAAIAKEKGEQDG